MESDKELKANENELTEFIKKDEEETQKTVAAMEAEVKKKKQKEQQIKKIESEISALKSDINKNMDILHTQEEYKQFLGQLNPQSFT